MESYWIWKYGDFEIFHSNLVNCRREQYGADYPPFWKLYDVDRNVKFFCKKNIEKDGDFILYLNGKGSILVDDQRYPSGEKIKLTKGIHKFSICVFNLSGLPAAYIESDVLSTDKEWYTTDSTNGNFRVGFDKKYNSAKSNPEEFIFLYERKEYVSCENINNGTLFDFGREIFGFLYISNVSETDKIHVSYGESKEEALDLDFAVVQENISGKNTYKLRQRAFRYIFITGTQTAKIYAELEYLPLDYKGSFECNEKTVNDIWNTCAYTLKLNAREVFTEAIKRDRWLWCGDAYQTFKSSKYLFFDKEIVKRSLIGLRGKEPFDEHINTITDYSLYWIIALLDYYETYKDTEFLKFIYPRAVSLMNFCSKRENENGFIIGLNNDWIFIDWADIDKSGVVCAEQMIYIKALLSMYRISEITGNVNTEYKERAEKLTKNVNKFFWNTEKGSFIDNYESKNINVTRHANIFAVLYDIATDEQTASIIKNVLTNDDIPKITTPYFEGYELDVMGKTGNIRFIYDMINSYWKGMIDLGATTIWEEYNPELSGIEHYAMYGDKFQKSLCHAWGASPIYVLGKYYLGVEETSAGYHTFKIEPHLGKFKYIKGRVPLPDGFADIYLSEKKVSVKTNKSGGVLIWNNKKYNIEPNHEFILNYKK